MQNNDNDDQQFFYILNNVLRYKDRNTKKKNLMLVAWSIAIGIETGKKIYTTTPPLIIIKRRETKSKQQLIIMDYLIELIACN